MDLVTRSALGALALAGSAAPTAGRAQEMPVPASASATGSLPCVAYVDEAASRFGVPARWVQSVMRRESAGDYRAVSSAGAMGCMQIMPRTWIELTRRYRLGDDPFDTRANMLAGTAYLREMFDRFGIPGAFAAYNAGPGRYEHYLQRGQSLPGETVRYVAVIVSDIGEVAAPPLFVSAATRPQPAESAPPEQPRDTLFFTLRRTDRRNAGSE